MLMFDPFALSFLPSSFISSGEISIRFQITSRIEWFHGCLGGLLFLSMQWRAPDPE